MGATESKRLILFCLSIFISVQFHQSAQTWFAEGSHSNSPSERWRVQIHYKQQAMTSGKIAFFCPILKIPDPVPNNVKNLLRKHSNIFVVRKT